MTISTTNPKTFRFFSGKNFQKIFSCVESSLLVIIFSLRQQVNQKLSHTYPSIHRKHIAMESGPESLTLSRDVKRACELLEKLQKSKYCGEVPATKLAALQKVLQSEFLNAVREVYEHVYETVGGLKRGDQLLSVNGVSVEGENHEKAVELLKAAIGSVKLVVRYTPKVLEEMEMRFDKQRQARRQHLYS